MTERKYLVYDSRQKAEKARDEVWEKYKQEMQAKGREVVANEIVSINASTGLPDYEAQRTIAWDEPQETEDGKYILPEPPSELKQAIKELPEQEILERPKLKNEKVIKEVKEGGRG